MLPDISRAHIHRKQKTCERHTVKNLNSQASMRTQYINALFGIDVAYDLSNQIIFLRLRK